jgi:hypothetical protein
MSKKTMAKVAGFTAALGVTGALVGVAASSTGAYFTDSHSGTVSASTGGVHVNTSDLALNFTSLLPGEYKTNTVSYTAAGTGAEDIWLVLPSDGTAGAFNGLGGSSAALGRYGHFAVTSPAGSFTSYNLSTDPTSPSTASCGVDVNGHGGSNQEATSTNNADNGSYVPYCAVPNAILLDSNLTYGQSGSADITFGFTKLLKSAAQEDSALASVAQFKIVATQHGIRPDDVNNPS